MASGFAMSITGLAAEFEKSGMKNTANQIRSFESVLATLTKQAEVSSEWSRIESVFMSEWTSGSTHRSDIYEHVFSVIAPVLAQPNTVNTINNLIDLFERRKRAEDTIREIARLSAGSSTSYQGFLLLCFSYLMSMEGVFDENARFLLIIAQLGKGTAVPYSTIENDSWSTLKDKLGKFGHDFVRVIFDGYENHLRNSIAHARFEYDQAKNTITFEDFDTGTHSVSWGPCDLSYQQVLDEYYQKIEDLATFIGLIIGMLQLRALFWKDYSKLIA